MKNSEEEGSKKKRYGRKGEAREVKMVRGRKAKRGLEKARGSKKKCVNNMEIGFQKKF